MGMGVETLDFAPAGFGEPAYPARAARPLEAARPRRRLPIVLPLVLCFGAIGAVWWGQRAPVAPEADEASSAPRGPKFVDGPDLAPLVEIGGAASYRAQANPADGSRIDRLTLGDAGGGAPFLAATVRRGPSAAAPAQFFVDMATVSAGFGAAVERSGVPATQSGGRGPMESAELSLKAGAASRDCLGFRFGFGPGASLSGVACPALGAAVDRAALACLLERLVVTKAGREAGLKDPAAGAARPVCRKA